MKINNDGKIHHHRHRCTRNFDKTFITLMLLNIIILKNSFAFDCDINNVNCDAATSINHELTGSELATESTGINNNQLAEPEPKFILYKTAKSTFKSLRHFLKKLFIAFKFLSPEIKLFSCLFKFILLRYPDRFAMFDVENMSLGRIFMRTMMSPNRTTLFQDEDIVINSNNRIGDKIKQLTVDDYTNVVLHRAMNNNGVVDDDDDLHGTTSHLDDERLEQKNFYHPRRKRGGESNAFRGAKDNGALSASSSLNENEILAVTKEVEQAKDIHWKGFTFMTCAKIYFFHLFWRLGEEFILKAS